MKTLRIAGFFLLLGSVANAASFDCGKAKTPFERAVCGNTKLSVLDDKLNEAYTSATTGLSAEAKATVVKGQRNWLVYAPKACGIQDTPLNRCLSNEYTKRVKELDDLNKLNAAGYGIRFYGVAYYSVVSATKVEDGFPMRPAQHEVTFPQIDSVDAVAKAFNALADKSPKQEEMADDTSDSISGLTVQSVTKRLISVREDYYFYGHGAAHGQSNASYLHFLRPEGRGLKAEDVFKGEDWKKKLPELVQADLIKKMGQLGFGDADSAKDSEEIIRKESLNPERWSFETQGLTVIFNPYEVGPYAAGMPEATVPWAQLKPYFGPSASVIVGVK